MEAFHQDFANINHLNLSNGEQLAYRKVGSGPKIIVFIHGNISSSFWWYNIIKFLDFTQSTCYFPDLRGFGYSSYTKSIISIQDLADDLNLFAKELQIEQACFVGWSLGGAVCQYLAANYQSLVKNIVLVGSCLLRGYVFFETDPENPENQKMIEEPEKITQLPHIQFMWGAIRDKQLELMRGTTKKALFHITSIDEKSLDLLIEQSFLQRSYLDCILALHFMKNQAKQINCPVLVYHGKQDLIINVDDVIQMEQSFTHPTNKYIYKDNCSHSPPFDFPEELVKEVMNFQE